MPRPASPHWHKQEQCYRTKAGGRTKRFLGIAKNDRPAITRAFAEYMAELDREARPPEPTGLDIALAFTAEPMGRKPRTVQSHGERLAVFCGHEPRPGAGKLGALRASEYKAAHLKGLVKSMQADGHSPHYIGGVVGSVKAAFAWAASDEGGHRIAGHPFGKDVKAPPIPRSPERYAERPELAAFLRFCRTRADRATFGKTPKVPKACKLYRRFARLLLLLIRVSAHTGARPGSLASAWWDDFDPRRGTIVLPPDRHKTGRKTGKPLAIHLPPILVRALSREMGREHRHPVAIFTHKRGRGGVGRGAEKESGEPWGEFTTLPNGRPSFDADTGPLCQAVRKLRGEAVAEGARLKAARKPTRGLELIRDDGDNRFVIYRLRHTFVSDGLMGGVASASIAELTGTSDRMISQVYGHLLEGHIKDTSEAIHATRRRRGK